MELYILGCDGTYPSANGATSGYLLDCGEQGRILLDCGSGVLSKLIALTDPARLKAIVLTHWHNDHAADLLVLRYHLMLRHVSLPLYAPVGLDPLRPLVEGPEFVLHELSEGFVLDGITLDALSVPHPVEAYAVRIRAGDKELVYTGDTSVHPPLERFCRHADLLLCDATFLRDEWHQELPHMSAEQAAELAKAAQVKHLLLTHCPPSTDSKQLLKEAQAVYPQAESAQAGRWYSL